MPLTVNRSWAATYWLPNGCIPEETIMRNTPILDFNRNARQCRYRIEPGREQSNTVNY
jgi:hypothetical protein